MIRESLYDISWKVSEPEYRKDEAYSYSTIAKFDREGFENLSTLYDKVESPSLLFGSMVDTLLTDGPEEFDNKYVVAEFSGISDTIIKVVRLLFGSYNEIKRSLDLITFDEMMPIITACGYQSNWKPETRVKNIKEKGVEYYNLLFLCKDKTLVSTKDYNDAVECVNILRTDPMTAFYFEQDNPFNKDIERFYQLKFKGEYEGIKLRCMADLIIVNHQTKEIIPCDLKTSFKPEYRFYKSFLEWRYYHQANLYTEIIKQNIEYHPLYKDYKILPYRFIIISRNTKTPLVWEDVNSKSITPIKYGKDGRYEYSNWRTVIKDLHYYLSSRPSYPKEIEKINNIQNWLNK